MLKDANGDTITSERVYIDNVYNFINDNIYKIYKNTDDKAKIDGLAIDYASGKIGLCVKEFDTRSIDDDNDDDFFNELSDLDDAIVNDGNNYVKTNSDINNNINENNEEECDLANPEVIELLKSTNDTAFKTLEAVSQSVETVSQSVNILNDAVSTIIKAVDTMNENIKAPVATSIENKQDLNYKISSDGKCIKFDSKDLMGKFITIEYNGNMIALDCARIINDAVAQCPGKSIVDTINVKSF